MIDKRVVIITGATGNMGMVTTRKYTDMGDAVVMADIDEAIGKERETELRAEGREVLFVCTDLSKESDCIALVNKTIEVYGRVDVLCNNAAMISFNNNFLTLSLEEFNKVLSVNLVAQFIMCKLVATKMIETGTKNGVIINTGSIAGIMTDENSIVYPVSKAGVHSLTQCAARELAPKGIRVVAIAPGGVNGKMKHSKMNPKDYPELCEMHMHNRVLDPQEIANVSYFLSTPEASGINGTVVRVDDGYTAFKVPTSLLNK